jgi:hypothetical protein
VPLERFVLPRLPFRCEKRGFFPLRFVSLSVTRCPFGRLSFLRFGCPTAVHFVQIPVFIVIRWPHPEKSVRCAQGGNQFARRSLACAARTALRSGCRLRMRAWVAPCSIREARSPPSQSTCISRPPHPFPAIEILRPISALGPGTRSLSPARCACRPPIGTGHLQGSTSTAFSAPAYIDGSPPRCLGTAPQRSCLPRPVSAALGLCARCPWSSPPIQVLGPSKVPRRL